MDFKQYNPFRNGTYVGQQEGAPNAPKVSPDFISSPNVAATSKSIVVGSGATQTIIDPNKGISGNPVTLQAAPNGNISITAGTKNDNTANQGEVTITAGSGSVGSGTGGAATIQGGAGGLTNGTGGQARISGGDSQGSGIAGGARVEGGTGGTTGRGGSVVVTGGQGGTTSGNGGQIFLEGGDAAAGNSNGGDVNILPGLASGSGSNGLLYLFASTFSSFGVTLDPSLITAQRALKFPDAAGTFALQSTVTTTFTTADAKTVTVTNGIITNVA
jgi:hypothetical protein